jgi:hypothetical protein
MQHNSMMVSADALKGRNIGTSCAPLLGPSATGPIGSRLGFLHLLGLP